MWRARHTVCAPLLPQLTANLRSLAGTLSSRTPTSTRVRDLRARARRRWRRRRRQRRHSGSYYYGPRQTPRRNRRFRLSPLPPSLPPSLPLSLSLSLSLRLASAGLSFCIGQLASGGRGPSRAAPSNPALQRTGSPPSRNRHSHSAVPPPRHHTVIGLRCRRGFGVHRGMGSRAQRPAVGNKARTRTPGGLLV